MSRIMQVTATGTGWTGAPGYYVYYFSANGGANPVTADAQDVSNRVRAFWNAQSTRLATTHNITFSPQVRVIEATSGLLQGVLTVTTPTTVVGTGGTAAFGAAPMHYLLRGETGQVVGTRLLRTRHFFGPLRQDLTGQPVPTPGDITNMVNNATAQLLTGTTLSFPVCWHRPKNGAAGSAVIITSYSGSTKWAVLRSRRD